MRSLNHRFEVSIFPSLKVYYINRFYIPMKFVSVRLSARLSFPFFRQSACYPPSLPMFIVFLYSSVRPLICLERWNCQANSVLAHIVLTVHQLSGTAGVVPLSIRKVSVSNLRLKTGHQLPFPLKYLVVEWQFWCSDIYCCCCYTGAMFSFCSFHSYIF